MTDVDICLGIMIAFCILISVCDYIILSSRIDRMSARINQLLKDQQPKDYDDADWWKADRNEDRY